MFAFYDTLSSVGNVTSLIIYDSSSIIIPKRYYGFKQFVNFIRPGYVRVNTTSDNKNLYVSSYLNPAKDTLVLVAINDTNIVLSNVTFHCPASTLPILQYATCDVPDYNTTQLDIIPAPVNGNFVADMQAMSIKTFVILLNYQTGIFHEGTNPPVSYSLSQNYPNPFNPTTAIIYQLPVNSLVRLKIYDVLGREVQTLVDRRQNAGSYSVNFKANNLPSGVYFYRLETGSYNYTKKLLLLK
jgi:hypothetical protein